MRPIFRRLQQWGAWACLVLLVSLVSGVARAQVTPDELTRRIQNLEGAHADNRMTAIETRLDTLEYIGKGILVIVAAQLVLNGLNLRGRKEDRR